MARTPRKRLAHQLDTLDELVAVGDMDQATHDHLHELAKAVDASIAQYEVTDEHGDAADLEPRSIAVYIRTLRLSVETGLDLLDTDADGFNAHMDALHSDGRSKRTLVPYQIAGRWFFRYYDDLGVDPDAIAVYNPDTSPKHDEQDMFTQDEVWALREACGRTRMPTRNRAFLELLVHSAQRRGALLTLRLGDVDVGNGYFYLNDEVEGLKGARQRGRKRPLFGARKYVREWIDAHPREGDDDWLFVGDPSHWKTDLDDHWAGASADKQLRRIGELAGVEKPVNAHNFRHYCVTVLRRDYDLGWDTINMLAGVVKGSTMPRTTYNHVDDAEHIDAAEVSMGYADDEEDNRFAPPVCPTCEEVLKPHWRECPSCRELFAPDGRDLADEAQADSVDDLVDGPRTDDERRAVAAALKAVREE